MRKIIITIAALSFLAGTVAQATIVDISVATDKPTYLLGEEITVFVTAYNPSSEQVILSFPTTFQASYLMDGIFDWSEDKVFSQIPTGRIIEPYDSYTWNLIHDSKATELYPLTIGTHTVIGEVVGYGYSPPAEFEVIPEPATFLLLATGLVGVLRNRHKHLM